MARAKGTGTDNQQQLQALGVRLCHLPGDSAQGGQSYIPPGSQMALGRPVRLLTALALERQSRCVGGPLQVHPCYLGTKQQEGPPRGSSAGVSL